MQMSLNVLTRGSCEGLKAGVHVTALGLAVVMGVYNLAAWVRRREPHLAVNTVLYAALIAWEHRHVAHHVAELRHPPETVPPVAVLVHRNTPKPADVAA